MFATVPAQSVPTRKKEEQEAQAIGGGLGKIDLFRPMERAIDRRKPGFVSQTEMQPGSETSAFRSSDSEEPD